MNSLLLLLVSVLLCFVYAAAEDNELILNEHKEFDQCDYWAEHDGECVNNPRFMWSACLGSCLKFARDVDEQCLQWAREGECEANPAYIHIHCPFNCSLAIAWNPWVRQRLGVDRIRSASFVEDRIVAVDVLSAARLMQQRLESIFLHNNFYVQGFSIAAPSHFLGVAGLSEAFLYTMRLQEVLLHELQDEASFLVLRDHIDQALRTIRDSRFNADLLSRELPFWMRFVGEVDVMLSEVLEKKDKAFQENFAIPAVNVAAYFTAYKPVADSSKSDFADVERYATTITLNNGREMPLLGLGTWQLDGEACYTAVRDALSVGYRAIDTAQAYGNEAEVGRAIADAIAQGDISSRQEVFIATKVSNEDDFGAVNVRKLVLSQLAALRTDYIDLYMLHSPPQDGRVEAETWQALEQLVTEGKILSLGVSNYEPTELERLFGHPLTVRPSVVQNKVDPYHIGKQLDVSGDEIVAFCRQHNLQLVGYSAFSAYPFVMEATQDPLVQMLARERTAKQPANQHAVTPAQMVLRWMIQRNIAVIPRSTHKGRMLENLRALRIAPLTDNELAVMDSLQTLVSSPVSVPISLI